ncbi:hypothetical protein SK069_10605 [Patulibacter brassicae]|uniref:HD domain-containing protein n=1 Tax=Patulibacter brassicae TaxID=1705717 RepID=A0ABU4VMN6_9ACTN|nr:HD domain-containing protein [Patulibacter brassicae]MDX8152045.1 hypothetical protein [Patulibacter brassicae]
MTRPWEDLDRLVSTVEAAATHLRSSIHGPSHWRAVAATAAELADATGPAADRELLLLFALLHDAKREDDGYDPDHGPRAAILLDELRAEGRVTLDDERAERLAEALRDHTRGTTHADVTIGVCWDADRLLIGRVGLVPDARYCSTPDGRRRATAGDLPALDGPPSWHDVALRLGVA